MQTGGESELQLQKQPEEHDHIIQSFLSTCTTATSAAGGVIPDLKSGDTGVAFDPCDAALSQIASYELDLFKLIHLMSI